MSSLALRVLAIVTMLIDHVGYALEPVAAGHAQLKAAVTVMRLIGRIAMPIFCFLIAEGYFHTRDVRRYAGRLLLFALVSEIPFDLFGTSGAQWFRWSNQNVFFTLLLGLLAIHLFDTFALRNRRVLALVSLLGCAALAVLFETDYNMFGVLFVFIFYCFRTQPVPKAAAFCVASVLLGLFHYLSGGSLSFALILACAAFAIIPILLYNGQRGRGGKVLQFIFYAFYPAHLTLIVLILPWLRAWAVALMG